LQNVKCVQSQWALTAKVVELGRALRQTSGDGVLVAISIYRKVPELDNVLADSRVFILRGRHGDEAERLDTGK
jgi:hypothetical protein